MFWFLICGFATIISGSPAVTVVFLFLGFITKAFEMIGLSWQKYVLIYVGHITSEVLAIINLLIAIGIIAQ